jgi:hypothetical protein
MLEAAKLQGFTRWRYRMWHFCLLIGAMTIVALAVSAFADARSDYLIRLLKQSSSQFRVRAQAAISLGSVRADQAVIEALSGGLRDSHSAVRAASASSLERIGDRSALPALELALKDEEEIVRSAAKRAIVTIKRKPQKATVAETPEVGETIIPSGPPKYYVGIGMPGSRAPTVDKETLRQTRKYIEGQVRAVEGVIIAPEKETPSAVRKVLKAKKLRGYYLDSSVVTVDALPEGGARASVSIIVGTYPERNMRTILQGSARVIGNAGSTKTQAIEGAFRGALRQLPKVLNMSDQ